MTTLSYKARKGNTLDVLPELYAYITRNEVTEPQYLCGFKVQPREFTNLVEWLASQTGQCHGKVIFHIVLAFDPIKDADKTPEQVYDVGRKVGYELGQFCELRFIGVMDLHLDTTPAHIHYLFSNIDYKTGRRFSPNKRDLADIKKYVNYVLIENGFSPIKLFESHHRELWE
ncbi:MAG: relaxase/mobilization nuclease domain-containing protein [Dialister sp.]|nr:relaxase/mobilization nuclease domain-containing protein [Dialister sp.]